jgi:hypothetical protein
MGSPFRLFCFFGGAPKDGRRAHNPQKIRNGSRGTRRWTLVIRLFCFFWWAHRRMGAIPSMFTFLFGGLFFEKDPDGMTSDW